MSIACVLITHLRAKVELRRRLDLADVPTVIVERSRGRPVVADRFPAADRVPLGATVEEALSLHAGAVVIEADEPAYRAAFQRVLAALQGVSDRVEEAGTGHGLRGAGRPAGDVRGRGPAGGRPAQRGARRPGAPDRCGPRQVSRDGRRIPQRADGRDQGPAGRRGLPVAPPHRPPPRRGRDAGGAGSLRPSHPGRRGGDGSGNARRPVRGQRAGWRGTWLGASTPARCVPCDMRRWSRSGRRSRWRRHRWNCW